MCVMPLDELSHDLEWPLLNDESPVSTIFFKELSPEIHSKSSTDDRKETYTKYFL